MRPVPFRGAPWPKTVQMAQLATPFKVLEITMLFFPKVQGLLSQLAACRCDDAVDLTRQGFVDGLGLVRVQYASYLGHSAVTH